MITQIRTFRLWLAYRCMLTARKLILPAIHGREVWVYHSYYNGHRLTRVDDFVGKVTGMRVTPERPDLMDVYIREAVGAGYHKHVRGFSTRLQDIHWNKGLKRWETSQNTATI